MAMSRSTPTRPKTASSTPGRPGPITPSTRPTSSRAPSALRRVEPACRRTREQVMTQSKRNPAPRRSRTRPAAFFLILPVALLGLGSGRSRGQRPRPRRPSASRRIGASVAAPARRSSHELRLALLPSAAGTARAARPGRRGRRHRRRRAARRSAAGRHPAQGVGEPVAIGVTPARGSGGDASPRRRAAAVRSAGGACYRAAPSADARLEGAALFEFALRERGDARRCAKRRGSRSSRPSEAATGTAALYASNPVAAQASAPA